VNKYAVIESGGKQYRVTEGQSLQIEKLTADVGATVHFEAVLAVKTDTELKVGSPLIKGAKVEAEILEQGNLESSWIKRN